MKILTASLLTCAALGAFASPAAAGDEVELDEAEVFIEFNSTDGDFGIQFFWDGEPWKTMRVGVEGERVVLNVKSRGNVKDQGLTEGFFESAEPPADVLPMEEFLARFPEGIYEFEGKTLEGDDIEGETEFTHTMPAPPSNLWPADGTVLDHVAPLVLSIDPVTEDLDGEPLEPELYEFIVEIEEEVDGEELLRVFTMTLPGDEPAPAVTLPPQFLKADGEYKFEVIVQEESGNRTISETEFTTLP